VFDTDPSELQGEPGDGESGEPGDGQGNGNDGGQTGEASQDQGGEGQPGQGEPGDQKGEGTDSEGGKGEAGADDTKGKLSKSEAHADYSDLLGHDHKQDARSEQREPGGGLSINYDQYFRKGHSKYGDFTPALDQLIHYDCSKGEYPWQDHRSLWPEIPPSMLSKRIGRYMQAHSKNKRVHGQKSGKLDGRNLHRLKNRAMGEARKRVFHQTEYNKSKDVAVFIGVDMSGSMSGDDKAPAAQAAVTHLHEVISRQLRIPLEIVGFSLEHGRPAFATLQRFGQTRRNEAVADDVRRILPFSGANRDGEFLIWARERLLQQRAGRHIMIILSDGQPIHRAAGDVAGYTKEVCIQMDKDPRIEMHGIGILSESVRHFYKSCDVIYNVNELEEKLLTVLKNKIIINL
jgi:cobalamin biosynthesis protein CobT